MSGKLGFTGLGSFKLGDSPAATAAAAADHVCFTYQGDDAPAATYEGTNGFSYQGDDTPAFTYQGEC